MATGGAIIILLLFLNQRINKWQIEAGLEDATPDIDLMTPSWAVTPENPDTFEMKREIISQRAQELFYNPSSPFDYYFSHEFHNPLFHQSFPETHLYVILYDTKTVCSEPCDTEELLIMASRQGKDYRMPGDFSQLAIDAGYQLTEEMQDSLAYALILVTLPLEMTQQSISCGESYTIDKKFGYGVTIHFTYAIDCQAEYTTYDYYCSFNNQEDCIVENITDISAWFSELGTWPSYKAYRGIITWGNITEDGWREIGRSADLYFPTTP